MLRLAGRGRLAVLALLGALIAGGAGAGVAALVSASGSPASGSAGQVLVLLTVDTPVPSGTTSVHGSLESVRLRSASGWRQVTASPASFSLPGHLVAPSTDSAELATVPVGTYTSAELKLRVAGGGVVTATKSVALSVSSGRLTPLLFSLRLTKGGADPVTVAAAYAGNDQVNLGIQVASGRVLSLPNVHLVDQRGRPFSFGQERGKVIVLASFLTVGQETGPLVDAALLQLHQLLARERLQSQVKIVAVTQDPAHDTPAILARYQRAFNLPWPLLTGTPAAIKQFWSQLQVAPIQLQHWSGPAPVDRFTGKVEPYAIGHPTVVDIVNPQGYVASQLQDQPTISVADIPAPLYRYLDPRGLQRQRAGGAWTARSLLATITPMLQRTGVYTTLPSNSKGSATVGSEAPTFTLPSTAGGTVSLARQRGHPVLIDFWATWCTNCRADMKLVAATAAKYRSQGLRVLLIDYQESGPTASKFLRQQKIGLPSLLDKQGAVATRYGVPGLPVAVFVNSKGQIGAIQVGELQSGEVSRDLAKVLGF